MLEAMFPGYSARQLFEFPEPAEPASPNQPDPTTHDGRPESSTPPEKARLVLPDQTPASALTRPAALGLPDHAAISLLRHNGVVMARGTARTDWDGQVIAMSADRARDFLTRIEATNVGAETLDQLFDDLRHLLVAYLQQPLLMLLGDLVGTQNRAFELLEGRQRPDQTRDLYLVVGITCGLMAMVSRDLGANQDAMTQARTGYACADNAGHDGLRAWIRGLQANIAYWAGRWDDALHCGEARTLGALNRLDEAHAAIARAADARDRVQPDELDILGGLCDFIRPNQLNYAAEVLSWGGASEAGHAERFALESLESYTAYPGGSFRNEATARCALAGARVVRGAVDGAVEPSHRCWPFPQPSVITPS